MNADTPHRVLIAGSDDSLRAHFKQALASIPGCPRARSAAPAAAARADPAMTGDLAFETTCASDASDVIAQVESASAEGRGFTLIFIDADDANIDAVEMARLVRARDAQANIILVSDGLPENASDLPHRIPPADRFLFLSKPLHPLEILQLARSVCKGERAIKELEDYKENLGDRIASRAKAIYRISYYDTSTGLPNRVKLMSDLDAMIESPSEGMRSVAVALIDIHKFSRINETMGYEAGTALLAAFGERLSARCHNGNVAGRFGDDEFACLIEFSGRESDLNQILNELRAALLEPFSIEERDEIFLRSAIGVACFPRHGNAADEVFRCAETALTQSKAHLLRRPIVYHSNMGTSIRRRMSLEGDLRPAVMSSEIVPHFQPQVRVSDRRICGVEVLARWEKPSGESIAPAEFVPLVEELGLATRLFDSILEQSLQHIAAWQAIGWKYPSSINLSPYQLHDEALPRRIQDMLNFYDVPAKMLRLELTESGLVNDLDIARSLLGRLTDLGIEVHVDDFGTGYSSFAYLADLPVAGLKIDQSFISGAHREGQDKRAVQAMAAMGHAMKLDVIAEGVETENQLAMLKDVDCDIAQGYLCGRPMSAGDFCEWLVKSHEIELVHDEPSTYAMPDPRPRSSESTH